MRICFLRHHKSRVINGEIKINLIYLKLKNPIYRCEIIVKVPNSKPKLIVIHLHITNDDLIVHHDPGYKAGVNYRRRINHNQSDQLIVDIFYVICVISINNNLQRRNAEILNQNQRSNTNPPHVLSIKTNNLLLSR